MATFKISNPIRFSLTALEHIRRLMRRKHSDLSADNGEDSKPVSTSIESVSKLTVLSSNARKRARGDVFNVSEVPIRRSVRILLTNQS